MCSSITTITEVAFLDHSGDVAYHFMVELGKNEEEVAKRVKEFGAQVVLRSAARTQ